MALEKTQLMAKLLTLALDAAAKVDTSSMGPYAEDRTPAQVVHLTKLALALHTEYQLITSLAEEIAKTATPTDLGPLLLTTGNAVQSIDQALQTVGIDMGLREEHLTL